MTKWIETVSKCFPSDCMNVLLYVVMLHDDKESLFDEEIISGFYDEESNKWAYNFIDEDGKLNWKYINETDTLKIVAWTLTPEYFDYNKYKDYRKKFRLNLFL